MDNMVEAAVGIAVFFVLFASLVINNYQDAIDSTNDADVENLIYLVLVLFLVAVGLGTYYKMK